MPRGRKSGSARTDKRGSGRGGKTESRARSNTQPRHRTTDERAHAPAAGVAPRRASSSSLRQLLAGIGAPAPAPFAPDPFQLEALARLEHEDVLVTAPTGSGKTWIAREEIRRLLGAGKRAWYTSPLKALTNSKYVEFAEEFGAENVGILTGDRKENSAAPLLVGTTEVYRNQLFDALRRGENTSVDLVILDEAHYLGDEERGHVWEETIILCPPRVRLLLLSATVGNARDLARWIADVRGTTCTVVERKDERGKPAPRPVPLRAAFLFPDGGLAPLVTEPRDSAPRELNPEVRSFLQREGGRPTTQAPRWGGSGRQARPQMPEVTPADLISSLGHYNLLPAIVFLPTRRRCDESAAEAAQGVRTNQHERRDERENFLRAFAEEHPQIKRHKHWEMVIRSGVAAHHAGHLPGWKVAIEHLMSRGLLDAIFATSTVAAGVDFPARTVVITVGDMRTNDGWRPLGASEFQQMTGRAGRRGKDKVGFIVVAPGRHQNPQRIAQLLDAPADDLHSQFRATYTSLLNLLDAYGGFSQVREIIERSFAHVETARRLKRLEMQRNEAEDAIKRILNAAGCDATPRMIGAARALERLASARGRVQEALPEAREEAALRWLDEVIVPGRVVRLGRSGGAKGRRLVFVTERRGAGVVGIRENGARASFALDRAGRVFEEVYPHGGAEDAFNAVHERRNPALHEPRRREHRAELDEAVEILNTLIERVTSLTVPVASTQKDSETADDKTCAHALWRTLEASARATAAERDAKFLREELWQPFARRARILEKFGYIDLIAERVTERGRWLADLRVDSPLLIGEALAHDLLSSLDASSLAGIIASIAADSDRSYGELPLDGTLVSALQRFEQITYPIADAEFDEGLEPPSEMNYSAAAAAARWAGGVKWETLVRQTGAEEGDLFRMLSRVGEALMQIAYLNETHPDAARRARAAAGAILREPVRSDEIL